MGAANQEEVEGLNLDDFQLSLFQGEVARQCKFALTAVQDMNQALQSANQDRFWYSVQGLLVALGDISKLLFPASEKIPNRGKELRDSLGVHDDYLLEPRKFRNHFEHYDERLETWILTSKRHNLADSNIMTKGAIAGMEPTDFMRNYDPQAKALGFQGDEYLLQPIVDVVVQLHEATRKADADRRRSRMQRAT